MVQVWVARDTITYRTQISACEKGGEWASTLQLLGATVQGRVEANHHAQHPDQRV